jgi:hypothetical protein
MVAGCNACGGDGEPCCPSLTGRYCGEGYICAGVGPGGGTCRTCGGQGEPCCLGGVCQSGTCANSNCP